MGFHGSSCSSIPSSMQIYFPGNSTSLNALENEKILVVFLLKWKIETCVMLG